MGSRQQVWFTSDTHFGHRRMAEIRGLASVEEMDELLVECWNEIVGRNDLVYHLGDFGFWKEPELAVLFGRLNGRKHLIAGNHDRQAVRRLGWESVSELREVRWQGQKMVLCHYPLVTWSGSHRGVWHLHGHSHGSLRVEPTTRLDVGVDTSPAFGPWAFEELAERFEERCYVVVDHHGAEDRSEIGATTLRDS